MESLFGGEYKGKRVLITGHTGFVGSWLCLWLKELGAHVYGMSLNTLPSPSAYEAMDLTVDGGGCSWDITQSQEMIDGFNSIQPEMVFHLAAQALVSRAYDNPALTMKVNTIGSTNILEAIRQTYSVKAALMITTDKVYQNNEWCWGYRETDSLGGDDPYSASKAGAELAVKAYNKSYFKEGPPYVSTARAGNVIGGGDWGENRLVPDCMRAWAKGEIVQIRNPHSTRPWQHILDLLSGYLLLGSSLLRGYNGGSAFNFGPSTVREWTVEEVVKEMQNNWKGSKFEYGTDNLVMSDEWKKHDTKWETNLLKLNVDKAWAKLGWKSLLPFEKRIQLTVEWYKAFYEKDPAYVRRLSSQHIKAYASLVELEGMEWG